MKELTEQEKQAFYPAIGHISINIGEHELKTATEELWVELAKFKQSAHLQGYQRGLEAAEKALPEYYDTNKIPSDLTFDEVASANYGIGKCREAINKLRRENGTT